ncbi:unnamed protein product, partial [Timema podura]|nr:unnamed protein product [Timema podura]
ADGGKLAPTTATKHTKSLQAAGGKLATTTGINVIRPLTTDETVGPTTGTLDARLPLLSVTSPKGPTPAERRQKTKLAVPLPGKCRTLDFNILEDNKNYPDEVQRAFVEILYRNYE